MPLMRRIIIASLMLFATAASAQYEETITVSRVLVDVRVTDANGQAIRNLTPAEFTVHIGRKRAEVASATWIHEAAPAWNPDAFDDEGQDLLRSGIDTTAPAPDRPGRLFVVFIQTDFQRAAVRVGGQMKFRRYAEELVRSFGPRDRLAVFSFDSHLKFRCDFTDDTEAVIRAMRESILINIPPAPPEVPEPALGSWLDKHAMKRAATSEDALQILATALRNIDGPKTMLLLGWGLGDRVGRFVVMKPQWRRVRRALEAARVTIMSLDTTDAYHDLAAGLSIAASQTGGLYTAAAITPHLAVKQVQSALEGRYELELIAPDGLRGDEELSVRVKRRGANVLAPSIVTISSR